MMLRPGDGVKPGPAETPSGTAGALRTQAAVQAWAAALPAARYDVRLVPALGGPVLRRTFGAGQMQRAVPWLRSMNAGDHHIYARPDDPRHVLVDDLDLGSLGALRRAHGVAAAVMTSPGSWQAWVTVSAGEVSPDVAGGVARLLARRYGGDPGAAAAMQVGRLPGYTNCKRRHLRVDGLFPYAQLVWARARVDPSGTKLVAEVLRQGAVRQGVTAVPTAPGVLGPCRLVRRSPDEEYAVAAARVVAGLPVGAVPDRSRIDFAVARRLLSRGMEVAAVEAVLLAGPRAGGLGPLAVSYVARTVAAAAQLSLLQ